MQQILIIVYKKSFIVDSGLMECYNAIDTKIKKYSIARYNKYFIGHAY